MTAQETECQRLVMLQLLMFVLYLVYALYGQSKAVIDKLCEDKELE